MLALYVCVGELGLRVNCVYVVSSVFFFFYKQKTAYEIEYGLVGSEMCIRGRPRTVAAADSIADGRRDRFAVSSHCEKMRRPRLDRDRVHQRLSLIHL